MTTLNKIKTFTGIAAVLSFMFIAPAVQAAAERYGKTVSVTVTASTVTPTTAKPASVVIFNDGANDVYFDFDRVAVATATTATRLKGCQAVEILFDKPEKSFTTLSIITATGTATARVEANYMRGVFPQASSSADPVRFIDNPGCSLSTSTLPKSGAAVASATTLPAPTGQVFHVTGTTAITSITTTNLVAGDRFTIIFDGVLTFTDGNNLVLAGNMSTTADDTITLVFDGTNLYETGRSVN